MAARVIHFGVDKCQRLNILKRAGYSLDVCSSLVHLRLALNSEIDADVVMMSDDEGSVPAEAISLTRSESLVPVIFFPSSDRSTESAQFDLVVPTFTPPEDWLLDLALLIVRSRAIRDRSQIMIEQSRKLRQGSEEARARSYKERERSRQECKRNSKAATRRALNRNGDEWLG